MKLPTLAAAAAICTCLAGVAHADPYEGVPNPQYPDGTGNDQVDRLNAGQLNPPPPPPIPFYGPTSYPAAPYPYAPPPPMPPGMYGAPRPSMYGAPPPPPND